LVPSFEEEIPAANPVATAASAPVEFVWEIGPGDGLTQEREFQFGDYGAVALDADGNVYVLDTNNHRVQTFDRDRQFVTAWGNFGTAVVGDWNSSAIAIGQ